MSIHRHIKTLLARASEGKTQQAIAEMLGWSRTQVANYTALRKIDKQVWEVIVTTFEDVVTPCGEDVVTPVVTGVTFTENLLRSILDLTPDQQLDLVSSLAKGDIQKGKFKTLAENYYARNEMQAYALPQNEAPGAYHTPGALSVTAMEIS